MKVVNALVARGVYDLERQVEALIPGFGRVRFDAAIPALKWALEIDVHPSHLSVEGSSKDKRRDRFADAAGWVTRRAGEDELQTSFEPLIDDLVASIARRRAGR